jgi:hypothetical protein
MRERREAFARFLPTRRTAASHTLPRIVAAAACRWRRLAGKLRQALLPAHCLRHTPSIPMKKAQTTAK